jgi:hypothetical protein
MKKAITLLCLSFLLSVSLYSQVLQYETEINYIHGQSGTKADITVTITKGDPDFTFFLMTNDLLKGEVLMQSAPSGKKSYTFTDVKPGKYMLKITDNKGAQTGKTVIIEEVEI